MAKTRTQEPPTTQAQPSPNGGAVVPRQQEAGLLEGPALTPAAQMFIDKSKGLKQEFVWMPLIQINHRTGTFVMPTGEQVEEVSGYPIYVFQTRKFYRKAYDPRSQTGPPDCWSADMLEPHPSSLRKESDTCANCPHNVFGSGKEGRGKACSTATWTFLLSKAFGKPPIAVVISPPSSLKSLVGNMYNPGYFSRMQKLAGAYQIVWTTFRLTPVEGGVHYTVEPVQGPVCDNLDHVKLIADLRNKFMEQMEEMRGSSPEVVPHDNEEPLPERQPGEDG